MPSLVLVVPGSLQTLTGGYGYDRRMVEGLRSRGWSVVVHELDDGFPLPSPAEKQRAAQVFAAIPDGATVLVDGLALGALPEAIEDESSRLRLVALIHHPLAAETGLSRDIAAQLKVSERRALVPVRSVIVTSRATADALAEYGVDQARIAVVEPGTDRAPVARGSSGAGLELLCVASLIPRKGHEILLRALATIRDFQWHLTCVGSTRRHPAMAKYLRGLSSSLGLTERVLLAGEGNAASVAEHYDRADLFVLPTFHEGYGMVVAEALARGLPVVSTFTGAIPELVGDHAGLLVPPGDVNALARALSELFGSADLRDRLRRGAEDVRRRLPSWDDASANLEAALLGSGA